jgi:hypothetical protein
MLREVKDVFPVADRVRREPGNSNALVGMCREALVPGVFEQRDEVGERRRVADLLYGERIGRLAVDHLGEALQLRLIDRLGVGAGVGTWPEQVLDVPRHDLEHDGTFPRS